MKVSATRSTASVSCSQRCGALSRTSTELPGGALDSSSAISPDRYRMLRLKAGYAQPVGPPDDHGVEATVFAVAAQLE